MKFRTFSRWIPAIIVMLIIFLFSAQPYEQQTLKPEIEKNVSQSVIAEFFDGITFSYGGHEVSLQSLGGAGIVEFFIRKAAHFSIYGLLGFLLVYALNSSRNGRGFFGAVLISFLYACSDELHQLLTPDRTPLFQDVLLDTAGAACGALLMLLLRSWRQRRRLKH